jgi:hypothetical protein
VCVVWLCVVQCARLLLMEGGADPCHVRHHHITSLYHHIYRDTHRHSGRRLLVVPIQSLMRHLGSGPTGCWCRLCADCSVCV